MSSVKEFQLRANQAHQMLMEQISAAFSEFNNEMQKAVGEFIDGDNAPSDTETAYAEPNDRQERRYM